MKITEAGLQALKREVEGYKNEKVRAEATLAEITRNIETQKNELAAEGITSSDDLVAMKKDIEDKYEEILESLTKYREVRK